MEAPAAALHAPRPVLRYLISTVGVLIIQGAAAYLTEARGPRFTLEPPQQLLFSNSSGGRADCVAEGSPPPRVDWQLGDGSPAAPVAGARLLLANGSLHFPPFRHDRYRPDVHSAAYRCVASNAAGRLVSLEMLVRAVVLQPYEARVLDAHVTAGNTALLRCQVPSFARDFLTVTSWLQDRTFNIYPSTEGDAKHAMLPTGELHVLRADGRDGRSSYRCRTLHRLTGRTQESVSEGRLLVEDKHKLAEKLPETGLLDLTSQAWSWETGHQADGPSAPRLVQRSPAVVVARRGDDVALPCVAQGSPPPHYWWALRREGGAGSGSGSRPLAVPATGERRVLLGGSLLLRAVQPEDAGVYVCTANNSAGAASADVQLRVLPELSAHVVPASLRADAGASADLLCVTSATQVHWLKDGQRLTQAAAGPRLRIEAVQREDQGVYQCVASLGGAAVQASAELRLGASRPHLLYKFIAQTLQPGPDVSLKCVAGGQPTPQVHWTLDGFPLPQSERFVIGQYVTISGDVISHVNISSVAVEDGGTYECAAANRVGRVSHRAPLRVYGLPLVRNMAPVSAVAGETLELMCPAAGFPIHAITWEKDGRMLPGNHRQSVGPDGTLTVENVQQRSDQGTYTCQARTRQGHSARGSVDVNVMEPPSIYPFSIESSVNLGERLGLQCLVTRGDAPLSITWLKDEAEVQELGLPAVTVQSPVAFSSTLLIERLTTQHAGTYTCRARNAAATAEHSVQLAVNVPPEITPFAFPELAEGARAQVTCSVHRGDPPLGLTWLKDGAPLPAHVNTTRFNTYSSIVTMNVVRRHDSGNYTCVASNAARDSAYTAHLSISVPPEWVVEPQDSSVIAGQSAALHCQADGFPQPTITWRRRHGKQAQREEVVAALPNGTLLLAPATEADEGFYLCKAHNGIGADLSAVVQLVVNALPRFLAPLTRETVRRGAAATFLCEAAGDAPMSISWLRNGARLPVDSDSRYHVKTNALESSAVSQLSVHNASAADSGKYVCVATNPFGKDETVVQLLVQDAPDPPADVRVEDTGSRDLKLAWTEPADGNSPILRYSVAYTTDLGHWPEGHEQAAEAEQAEAGGGGPRPWALVTGLTPATTYFLRVCAVNALGAGAASAVVSASTEPEAPAGPPRFVRAEPLGPAELRVSWEAPDPALRHGTLLGYYVGVMPAAGAGADSRYTYLTVKADQADQPSPLVLRDLRSYTRYKVTVQAFNSVGAGPSSVAVVAATLEAAPGAPPQDVLCSALSPDSLHVRWAPPPAAARNGLISGYSVQYERLVDGADWGAAAEDEAPATVRATAEEATLAPMHKFCNYSVQVAAHTAAGRGPLSAPLACRTAEDVPGPPAGARVALSSPRSAVLVWLPPAQPNGQLLRYHVYQREVRRGGERERDPARHAVVASTLEFEAGPLSEHVTYMWWVSAVTRVGEGPSSAVLELLPGTRVPAAILSFPKRVAAPWKTDVELPCRAVGYPQPARHWTFRGAALAGAHAQADGSLLLAAVMPADAGAYACRCENVHSNASVEHRLLVLVPPPPPQLAVLAAASSNLTLRWARPAADALRGYVLAWREAAGSGSDGGAWNEERLSRHATQHTVGPLRCGSDYEFSAAAVNQVGRGELGRVVRARTLGGLPEAPGPRLAVTASPRALTVHLERWRDARCPISHFVLERSADSGSGSGSDRHWTTVTDRAPPGSSYVLSELSPATYYRLRVTAYNTRGSAAAEFRVSTLTARGGMNVPTVGMDLQPGPVEQPVLSDLRVSLPIGVSALALVLTLVTAATCLRRKPSTCPESELPAARDVSSFPSKPDYFSALRKKPESAAPPSSSGTASRIPEYVDDIYPYATFQAQKPVPQVSSQRGFQTFVYQGSGLLDVDSYATREEQGDDYSQANALKSDTEEYDSLGSDSDSKIEERSQFHPTYHHSNIRHSRLVSMLESSTSTEPSPMPDRRIQPKKGRFKCHSPKKKLGLRGSLVDEILGSGSGDSGPGSGTKETAFSFPNHHKREELSEAECDRSSPLHTTVYYRV